MGQFFYPVKGIQAAFSSGGSFPGQPGNPVGFAATPASPPPTSGFTATGASSNLWPGAYPGSLTPAPNVTFASGTPSNPTIVSFLDIQAGTTPGLSTTTTPLNITGHDIIFIGCRFGFTSTNVSAATGVTLGSSAFNIQFIHCTGAPLTSFGTLNPPGAAWPSSGAGLQGVTQIVGTNCVQDTTGYQFWFGAYSTSTSGSFMVWVDHCDVWGFGNGALDTHSGTTGQINWTDNWVHDCCSAGPTMNYHQDGVGYFDGGTGPSNVLIKHNTICSVGANTNAIGWQTGPCNNIIMDGNYLSGYQANTNLAGNSSNTNSKFINNTFGTDVPWYEPYLADYSAAFTGTTNLYRNNKIKVIPGTSAVSWPSLGGASGFTFTLGDDGKYLLPNSTTNGHAILSNTDWTG